MPSGLALAYMSGRASRGHVDRNPSPTVLARALIALAPNPLKRRLRAIAQPAMRQPRLTLCIGKRDVTLAIGARSASRVINALMCDARQCRAPGFKFGSRTGSGVSSRILEKTTSENRNARRRMLIAVNLSFAPRATAASITADAGASTAMTVVARLREHGLFSAGSPITASAQTRLFDAIGALHASEDTAAAPDATFILRAL